MAPHVIGVLDDLFFLAKVQDIAKRAGLTSVFVKSREAAIKKAREAPVAVVIDLHYKAAEPIELIRELTAMNVPTMGFFSHVQVELKREAEAAGCTIVMPRSAMGTKLPEWLAARV
jgi:DNA-binding NarL/FixJ family response regulator